MLISIVIPAYNRSDKLRTCIERIYSSDYPLIEVIIVDDAGFEDISLCIPAHHKVRLLRNNIRMGPAYSRNIGAESAKGEILLFLDSDVYVNKDTISIVVKNFTQHNADAVVGQYDTDIPYRDFFSNYYNLRITKGYLGTARSTDLCLGAVFAVKKSIFTELGGFNIRYGTPSVEDIELGNRITASGYIKLSDKDLSVTHDKHFSLLQLIKNDFTRSSQRVEFAIDLKAILDTIALKPFNHTSAFQVFSSFLSPLFWISLFPGVLISRTYLLYAFMLFMVISCMNMDYLLFYLKKRGIIFTIKSLLFTFIDLPVAFAGIAHGLTVTVISKFKFSFYFRYLRIIPALLFKNRIFEITYFVTNLCNARCKHCFYHRNINMHAEELSISEVDKIFRNMPNMVRILLSGGEPFMRDDIAGLVIQSVRSAQPLHMTIPTNGILIQKITDCLINVLMECRHTVFNIAISIDDTGKERDNYIGVPGSFEKTVKTYANLVKLKERFSNLITGVIITQTATNQHRLENIYRYARDTLGADNISFCLVRDNARCKEELETDLNIYKSATDMITKEKYTARFPFWKYFVRIRDSVYRHVYTVKRTGVYPVKCFSGSLRLVIAPDGEVFPCEHLMLSDPTKYSMGNLRDYGYKIILLKRSQRYSDVINLIKGMECSCSHECDLTTNLLLHGPPAIRKAFKNI
ncbi:MAG: glycosyltransferase [Elusimicrobiota bacterium]